MPKKPPNKTVSVSKKPPPDHDMVEMIKYGIIRETKHSYHYRNYKYDSLEHAVAEARRSKKANEL